jgi:hypothetical protein
MAKTPQTEEKITREAYIKNFQARARNDKWQEKALAQAHDVRKFEIDLYWKRAAYFWTFIAAAFAGYVLVQKDTHDFKIAYTIACLGFIFSLAWYLVNRGSGAWQRNWEAHVDLLEDEVMGPLHKTVIKRRSYDLRDLAGPYAFSPSRINQLLSLIVTIVWFFRSRRSRHRVVLTNHMHRCDHCSNNIADYCCGSCSDLFEGTKSAL